MPSNIIINEQAIIIPVPYRETVTAPSSINSFNDIAQSNDPKVIGEIPNMAEFSRSLGWADNAQKQEFVAKTPGTHFIIPRDFHQFVPTLQNMIKQYYTTHNQDCYCIVGVLQAHIQPDEKTSDPFTSAHKDISVSRIKVENIPKCSVMIACDSLTTGYSKHKLSLSEIHKISNAEDPDKEISHILKQSDLKLYSYKPGQIIEHDITTTHALANPPEATFRTALIVNFTTDHSIAHALHKSPCLKDTTFDKWTDYYDKTFQQFTAE